jgi:hypothetical protein
MAASDQVFAGQIDRIVLEPESDALGRKVSERNRLAEGDVVVAVLAGEDGAAVGFDRQLPHLKFLGGDLLHVLLGDRDFVQQPIGTGGVGYVLGAVRASNVRNDSEAIPMLGAGELAHNVGVQGFLLCGHGAASGSVERDEPGRRSLSRPGSPLCG